jgi:hypothetical protein
MNALSLTLFVVVAALFTWLARSPGRKPTPLPQVAEALAMVVAAQLCAYAFRAWSGVLPMQVLTGGVGLACVVQAVQLLRFGREEDSGATKAWAAV